MEKGELDTTDGRGQNDNVVRFPKDWIGPLEDLVPIGPRARAQSSDNEDPPVPAEASDFWGEGAAAVHEAVAAPASRTREGRGRPPLTPRRVSRRGLAATGVAAGVAALAAVGVLVFGAGTNRPHHAATDDRPSSVTRFAADTLPLRQSGNAAGSAGLAAASSDAARTDRAGARRLQLVSERAMARGRKADAVLVSSSHHTASAGSSTATNDTSVAATETPSAPPAVTPTEPEAATSTSSSPTTTSDAGASDGSTSSSGDTSSGGSASTGTSSGSTSKTYGYGGLLGAGHAGS
jgi:hypothetical protein